MSNAVWSDCDIQRYRPSNEDFDRWRAARDAAVRADERDKQNQRYADVVILANRATRDLAAAQAVIAEVRAYLDEGKGAYPPDLYGILSQSPADALQAHDRQVAANALRVEADDFGSGYWPSHIRTEDVQAHLRGRAVSLVPGNPEPTDQTGVSNA